jgi:hypothetical protein
MKLIGRSRFIYKITVDGGMMLKDFVQLHRVAHRIGKRSNHVTIIVGSINNTQAINNTRWDKKTNPIGNRLVSSGMGLKLVW